MKYARKPAQTFTPGDDQPETPCAGRWAIYDTLIDYTSGPEFYFAKREALDICGSCPIAAACFRENRDEGWVKALAGPIKKPATTDDRCGTFNGAAAHDRRREELCQPCRSARTAKHRAYKQRRRAAA